MRTSWTADLPPEPQLGDELPPPSVKTETLAYLAERRSLTAAQMTDEPLPEGDLEALLRLAARVPDHRRVHPFRFITFEGEARAAFGEVLEEAFVGANPDAPEEARALERSRFLRAGVVVCLVSSPDKEHKTPEWEQLLTTGAVGQNLVIAAGAAGYAVQWLTEWYSYDKAVASALGLTKDERIAGFIYIGHPGEAPKERARMEAPALTSSWSRPRPG
ncbi:nitroreductase family protein [Parvularcula maris]|uniref:Putative NAD(P)H nitroreductase n=1 Tax=Parvularcula maris TaxID=2965077 RepID=A0A9X2L8K1_9PROT|nr:nitroreductase [Parvularcula maris]MCQ8185090.1 nitroreductase [Parvularcula maris]